MSLFHGNGISAVCRRQLYSLLSNPLGYVFIFAFVVIAGAFLFLPDNYYTRNIADLGPLFQVMPWMLVILLPALSMGAWATERELGTEELLLTLPFGLSDAILGKFLAVIAYFTLAMVCSLSNVFVLDWLGSPDMGLIIANYIGWWLAGIAFAAFGLLASVQVGMPAIAFVVGVLYCGILMVGANLVDWFDPFQRGVIPFGGVITALAATVAALGISLFMLSSRRWRPTNTQQIAAHVCSVVFAIILAINIGRLAYVKNIDMDVSSEGLASISATSAKILQQIENPVTIVAFISEQMPADMHVKAKEVTDKLHAVERSSGGKVTVEWFHPENPLDDAGQRATKEFGLRPFRAVVDTVSGRKPQDVFLSAAVVSGSRSQLIPAFDPGLSVEYEVVRAVRTVSSQKRLVLGVGSTDLKMTADFDFQTRQMRQDWALISELKKQYDVREVSFDVDIPEEIDVLMVPLPSSLTQPQLEILHDYIWAGRPALILEDPLPAFSGPQLAPSQPKMPGGNPMMQQQAPEQKADMNPFYRGLGLDFNVNSIVWSDFNPGHQFRGMMPPAFVWLMQDQKSIEASTITTGIDSVLLPFPGAILVADNKPESLKVRPLLMPSKGAKWGRHQFSDYFTQSFMGMQQTQPKRWLMGNPDQRPALAVEITGIMPSAYPKPDPSAPAPVTPAVNPDDPTKPAEPPAPIQKTGVPSQKPIHVVVVADTDFAINQIFDLYRNAGDQLSRDDLAVLRNLKNVQFIANAVDALASDEAFLALRTRRPQARPLSRIQDVMVQTDSVRREQLEIAENKAEKGINDANEAYRKATEKIDAQGELDANAKEQLKANIERDANRELQKTLEEINLQKDIANRDAEIMQDQTIQKHLLRVKWFAVGIPGFVMLVLVLGIASFRLRSERSHIPESRKRS